jgi:hypothetical protein
MKRDMDLCREILQRLEALPNPDNFDPIKIDGQPAKTVSYHVKLLWDAGLIEVRNVGAIGDYDYRPKCLTWAGHEFLESARDDGLWTKAKDTACPKGRPFTRRVEGCSCGTGEARRIGRRVNVSWGASRHKHDRYLCAAGPSGDCGDVGDRAA